MNPETPKTEDWKVGFEDVRREQLLAFARLSANEKLKVMEELLEAFQDRMPKHEFLESW